MISRDGRDVNTSCRGNRMSRVANIEHSENSVLLTEGGMIIIIENNQCVNCFRLRCKLRCDV